MVYSLQIRLKVAVYYDDLFDKQFGSAAKTRIHAVMAIVDEMYSEKDTLKTEIKVNVVGVKHAVGQVWGGKDWRTEVLGENLPSGRLAKGSEFDANLYVFLTGKGPGPFLGLAGMGTVCNSGRGRRTSVCKYASGSQKGGDAYTAEVRIFITSNNKLTYYFYRSNIEHKEFNTFFTDHST